MDEATKKFETSLRANEKDLRKKLQDLPDYFSTHQIRAMFHLLYTDVQKLGTMDPKQKEMTLHSKHEIFAFSFPTLYFRCCRDEIDPHIMDTLLRLKDDFDNGRVSEDDAKKTVIDGAKKHIELCDSGKMKRREKKSSEGCDSSVIELKVKSEEFG